MCYCLLIYFQTLVTLETVKKIVLKTPEFWSQQTGTYSMLSNQQFRKSSSTRENNGNSTKLQFDYSDFIKALKVR